MSRGFFDLVVIRGAAVDFFLLLDGRECLTRNGRSCDEDLPDRLLVLDLLAVSGWRLLSEEGMLSVCAVSSPVATWLSSLVLSSTGRDSRCGWDGSIASIE